MKTSKLLIITFYLIPFTFCLSPFTSVVAQERSKDTLVFLYDGNTRKLTMENTGTREDLGFELTNDFANWLKSQLESIDGRNCLNTGDSKVLLIYGKGPYVFENVAEFDAAGCRELVVHTYSDAVHPDGGRIPVRDTITPLVEELATTDAADDGTGSSTIPVLLIIIVAAVLVAGGGVAALIFIKKKKKEDRPIEEKAAELGLEVVEVVSEQKNSGLTHVHNDMESYYTMDIAADFADTAISKIYLHHTAVKKMYDFFKQSLESSEQTQETGCYFIGCWENADATGKVYNISVEDIVLPGDDITPGEFSFSFGKIISLNMTSIIDEATNKTGRGYVQTVWMHSHPGLGLFLSAHDLLVQQQLHYPEAPGRLAAFVIDTNTPKWDFAVFTPKVAGGMNNKEELRRTYSLDSLYEWSRHNRTASPIQEGTDAKAEAELKEKYHSVQVNHQGRTKTLNVFFSGRAINNIDDIVYRADGECKLGGYLVGNIDPKGNLIIEECSEEYSPKSLGIFITDSRSSYSEIRERYLLSNTWLCAIVSRSDEEMWILTRSSADAPCPTEADIAVSSMRPMKEWLRRRRVYK